MDKDYLLLLADALRDAVREGTPSGIEGSQYITMSETLAKEVESRLRSMVSPP